MTTEYLNSVRNYYGPRGTEDLYGAEVKTMGLIRQLEWTFNWDDLPAAVSGDPAGVLKVPAYAYVKSCVAYIEDALTGTSSDLTAGITGTLTGFITATEGDTLLVDADGDIVVGAGALIGTSIGAAAEELIVGISGSPTSGRAKIVIEYIANTAP
jgi:hypothetical protein